MSAHTTPASLDTHTLPMAGPLATPDKRRRKADPEQVGNLFGEVAGIVNRNKAAHSGGTPVCGRGQRGCRKGPECGRGGRGSHLFTPRPSRLSERAPSRVMAAVPEGCIRVHRMPDFLEAVAHRIEGRNAQFRRNVLAVAQQLAYGVEWRAAVVSPLWDELAAAAEVSTRTVCRVLRWLRDERLLGVVATGQSAEFSKDGENQRAVYVLTQPQPKQAVEETGVPTVLPLVVDPPHTREEVGEQDGAPSAPTSRAPQEGDGGAPTASARPRTRREAREESVRVARRVRARVRVLQLVSVAAVASVVRPFTTAGWTADDVLDAIEWQPDQTRHPHSSLAHGIDPRFADRVLARRLARWTGADGAPLASPSRRKAAAAAEAKARLRAHTEARRARSEAIANGTASARMPDALRGALDKLRTRRR